MKTTAGDVLIEVPRDREGTFEPVVVPKRKRDVSAIEDKVLAMYAKGMSQRDIADTIEDIYGFEISHETISEITDSVLGQLEEYPRGQTLAEPAIEEILHIPVCGLPVCHHS